MGEVAFRVVDHYALLLVALVASLVTATASLLFVTGFARQVAAPAAWDQAACGEWFEVNYSRWLEYPTFVNVGEKRWQPASVVSVGNGFYRVCVKPGYGYKPDVGWCCKIMTASGWVPNSDDLYKRYLLVYSEKYRCWGLKENP